MAGRSFVGRARERAELLAGLEEAAAGRGAVFLLAGEPGVGKTSLADWLAREADRSGVRAVWGRAWEAGGAPAYWPWRQALRALALELPAGEAGADADQVRFAHFERIVALLAAAGAERPLVLVLDDLHAADTSSLLLLEFVAAEIRSLPLLVLGTYREHAARLAPAAGGPLARVVRAATRLPLRRLDRGEVEELARADGASLDGATLAEVYRVTEGIPLFVREVLRLLPADAGAAARALPIPEGVREIIRERLARLEPPVRSALEVASVAGRDFSAAVVAAVTEAREDEVERQLAPAARAEVVVDLGAGRWGFTHVLLRDALYRALAPERRAALHGALAAALEGVAPGTSPAELAHHRLLAVPAIGVGQALDAALRAAERATVELAFEDAAALLERASPLAPAEPAAPRIDLLVALATARMRAGETVAGKQAAREAAALAAAAGDGERLARAALAHGAEFTPAMIDGELVRLLEDALAGLPPGDGALRARVMARLAAARQPAPDPEGPANLAREAIAMVRRAGDERDRREVLHAAISALADFAPPRERAALGAELLRRSEAAGDRVRVLRTHARLVFDHAEAGELAAARVHHEAYEALVAGLRPARYRWPALLLRAMWALFEGRDADFERLQAEARATGDPAADPNLRLALAVQRAEWRLLREPPERLAGLEGELGAAGAAAANRDLSLPAYAARVAARQGDLDRTRAALASIPADLAAAGQFHAIMLVEPVVAVRDLDRAARLHARLLPMADRLPSLGMSGMVLGPPMTRYLGLLAAALGRPEEASRHLADAVARLEALGGSAWLDPVRAEEERIAAPPREAAARPLRAPPLALVREGEYFTLRSGDRATLLRDSRGLRMLAHLLAHPGEEVHALVLSAPDGADAVLGDAGEVIDGEAARAYRARVEDAREALAEAERLGDVGRAERAREELEWLGAELARGVGLGGRRRRAASAAERARVNVQRRIRQAIERIGQDQPELGRFLAWTVKTGTYCSFQPDGTTFRAKSRSSS